MEIYAPPGRIYQTHCLVVYNSEMRSKTVFKILNYYRYNILCRKKKHKPVRLFQTFKSVAIETVFKNSITDNSTDLIRSCCRCGGTVFISLNQDGKKIIWLLLDCAMTREPHPPTSRKPQSLLFFFIGRCVFHHQL